MIEHSQRGGAQGRRHEEGFERSGKKIKPFTRGAPCIFLACVHRHARARASFQSSRLHTHVRTHMCDWTKTRRIGTRSNPLPSFSSSRRSIVRTEVANPSAFRSLAGASQITDITGIISGRLQRETSHYARTYGTCVTMFL